MPNYRQNSMMCHGLDSRSRFFEVHPTGPLKTAAAVQKPRGPKGAPRHSTHCEVIQRVFGLAMFVGSLFAQNRLGRWDGRVLPTLPADMLEHLHAMHGQAHYSHWFDAHNRIAQILNTQRLSWAMLEGLLVATCHC